MQSNWRPFYEPMRSTLVRTGMIALVLGAVFARRWGGLAFATLLMLWPSFGGHWVEIWFLNWLRPRLPASRLVQVAARFMVWIVGGIGLAAGMRLTAMTLNRFRPAHWPAWWLGGAAFIVIELAAHLILYLKKRPNFYRGDG